MTDILALDIATTTGWARGRVGEQPISGIIEFRTTPENRPYGDCIRKLTDLIKAEPRPDIVIVESLLPPSAMKQRGRNGKRTTTAATWLRLAGLQGIVRGVSDCLDVPLGFASVGDVRAHFISDRNAPRDLAKRAVVTRCRRLGWPCEDDNAGDALALWSYACALIDPQSALRVVPLFNRNVIYDGADLDFSSAR